MDISLDKFNDSIQALQEMIEAGEGKAQSMTAPSEEVIDANDLDCHRFFVHRLEQAFAARDAWIDYLSLKYRLDAGDEITPDGVILRRSGQ